MRISFVVPAFNEEAYLADCLCSIQRELAAKFPAGWERWAEIIVVNNASTDRTGAIARAFPRVRVVEEPTKGLTFARQAGFLASSGELIANVDADSRLTPGWVHIVLEEFERTPELAALSGPVVYYDLAAAQKLMVRIFYGFAFVSYAINRFVLRAGSMVQGGNFVVSRAALQRIGGFNLGIAFYGEDTDIARRLNEVGEVRFTFALKMLSSARRLRHEGILTMAAKYSVNYLWTTFLKRPFTAEYVDVREA
jgi:glycosyltransferase involved in cell wall biosynthesis